MRKKLTALTLAVVVGMFGALAPVSAVPVTITHSNTLNIVSPNTIACVAGDDTYLRTFDLAGDFGINGVFTISSVDIGVEVLQIGAQDVTVTLYTLDGAFVFANLTQIGAATVNLTPAQNGTVVNIPVAGVAPAGSILVVEVFSPDFSTYGNPNFFIGSNADGQTAPSYLAAPTCGAIEPTDVASLGVPNMHIVMEVNGDAQPAGVALCVNMQTGALSMPHPVNGCPPGTMPKTLPGATSTPVCINPATGAMVWKMGQPCTGNWRTHVVPDNGPLNYCAHNWTRALRAIFGTQVCTAYETPGQIPG